MDFTDSKLANLKKRFEQGLLTKEVYDSTALTPSHEQALLKQLDDLRVQFQKSVHEFELIVKPKKKSFMWIANLETVTLVTFANAIFNKYPQEDKEDVVFDLTMDTKDTYYPRTDTQFRELLRLLVAKNIHMMTVTIETPCKPFSDWSFREVCRHYELSAYNDPSLTDIFPTFEPGIKNLDDELEQAVLKQLLAELNARIKGTPYNQAKETIKSIYTYPYLLAAVNLFKGKFILRPERQITGKNGRGPVDYAFDACNGMMVGVTEVKRDDFKKGIAQNVVQLESALNTRIRKADEMLEKSSPNRCFGIVTDAEKWYFLECVLNNSIPAFKLSNPLWVRYKNEDLEKEVAMVLERIYWLLERVVDLEAFFTQAEILEPLSRQVHLQITHEAAEMNLENHAISVVLLQRLDPKLEDL
ncbi:7124_t:CDS:2 [Paraglomus brasilianum]|uniref:7124_t:CDS:1 n=1 Tax=Paraglomus brasilianum TaxID=144538 RepID=A0A9N9DT19_9GLOM|nr:7124_t:CDS:2 [Paraglomus brasilianum]